MDSIVTGFPQNIKADVEGVLKIMPKQTYHSVNFETSDSNVNYVLSNENISFPYRVYFVDVADEILNRLNEQEQNIIHCIYTRCCNGYVREKHLKALLNSNYDNWVIPYIVKVCAEYVVEILEIVYSSLKDKDTKEIKQFCIENKSIFCKDYNRMTSYWNEHYRSNCYNYKDYIRKKIFIELFGYARSMKKAR